MPKTFSFTFLFSSVLVASAASAVSFAASTPIVDILDPAVLRQLDQPGLYSFATIVGAEAAEKEALSKHAGDVQYSKLNLLRLDELNQLKNPIFGSMKSTIEADVEDLKKTSGEKMAYSSEQAEVLAPAGNVARHFDPFWLSSKSAAFPLVAIVNRIDKKDFFPGTCGELRFIYRLAYSKPEAGKSRDGSALVIDSRSTLPVFMNVIFSYPRESDGSCSATASKWIASGLATDSTAVSQWAIHGPLAKSHLQFKQIELNMQIVRFPAGQKIDFGGQAIYLFRIFQMQQGQFSPIPLENTPNVGEILRSKSLKADLLRQIAAGTEKLDQGTFVLENTEGRLLATRALSFSTEGRARLANKPFTALFGAEANDLAGLDFKKLEYIRSARGAVERLNNLSCTGCHQSSGTAGFHMLGMTGSLNSAFNQVILPFSPHFYAERSRRAAYTQALAENREANQFRPLSIATAARWTSAQGLPEFQKPKARDLCLLDSKDFAAHPSCESGSTCQATVENTSVGLKIGECVPQSLTTAGYICRKGKITTQSLKPEWSDLFNLHAFKDSIDINTTIMAKGLLCGNPKGGVPLGRISKACDANSNDGKLSFVDKLTSAADAPKEVCAMRGGPQFDECAKTKNPPECLANAKIVRAYLDTCSVGNFCREDYICQQLPEAISRLYSGSERSTVAARVRKLGQMGVGFCVPNYFVFNMRSDGHIIPEGRTTSRK
jgi:hypothetical protein